MFQNKYSLSLLLLFAFSTLFAQKDYRAELYISGRFDDFAVLPNGKIYVATSVGMTYYTDRVGDSWKIGPISTPENFFYRGEHMERVSFFNDSIGIISGYLHTDDERDYIYRTTDGGESWEKVFIPKGEWIDAEYTDRQGNAWLASSDQLIYYSSDFGASWQPIDRPENTTDQRIITLDFINPVEGLAGTTSNRLYYTRDNGDSWEILATPLDQKKYVAEDGNRPRIDKVLLTSTEMWIKQAGRVFYTDKKVIDWKEAVQLQDFAYDASCSYLYTFGKEPVVAIYEGNYGAGKLTEFGIPEQVVYGKAANGLLYSIAGNELYVIDHTDVTYIPLCTEDYPIEEYRDFKIVAGGYWAYGTNSFYHRDHAQGRFYRLITGQIGSPVDIYPLSESKAILTTDHYSRHFEYDASENTGRWISIEDLIKEVKIEDVERIYFEKGAYGCFHAEKMQLVYKVKSGEVKFGGILKNELEISSGNPAGYKLYDHSMLEDLLALVNHPLSYPSRFEPSLDNTDREAWTKLISQADALPELTSRFVDELLQNGLDQSYTQPRHSWSTNWEDKAIILACADGRRIRISSNNSAENCIDLSWTVDYDGLKYNLTGIALWRNYYSGMQPRALPELEKSLLDQLFVEYVNRK